MKRYLTGLTAVVLATTTPAEAATYAFTLGSSVGSGTGTFTTAGDASAGFTLIEAITGTFNGDVMTLLAPGTYPTGAPNDNLFRLTASPFTYNGVSFTAGDGFFNLYGGGGNFYLCYGVSTSGCFQQAQNVTFGAKEVPEPATWAMLLLGFAAVGTAFRRSRRVRTTVRFA